MAVPRETSGDLESNPVSCPDVNCDDPKCDCGDDGHDGLKQELGKENSASCCSAVDTAIVCIVIILVLLFIGILVIVIHIVAKMEPFVIEFTERGILLHPI